MEIFYDIIPSPLGDLYALASDKHLIMLEFADNEELERKIAMNIKHEFVVPRDDGSQAILTKTKQELNEYFEGKRKVFSIPLSVDGTDFQKKAWKGLEQIPYSETRSYLEQANMIGNPKAVRAIGGANHHNRIVIIIPCHRVIGKSGKLVGYGGGLHRKIWLLEHEKKYS